MPRCQTKMLRRPDDTIRELSGVNRASVTAPGCSSAATPPVATSKTRAKGSRSTGAVTISRPSGLKCADLTARGCSKRLSCTPLATSHTRTVRSSLAVTSSRPSGENSTARTRASWRSTGRTAAKPASRPRSARSQIRTVPSVPPVATRLPTGLKAIEVRGAPCGNRWRSATGLVPKTRASPLSDAVATREPSGLNVAAVTAPLPPARIACARCSRRPSLRTFSASGSALSDTARSARLRVCIGSFVS